MPSHNESGAFFSFLKVENMQNAACMCLRGAALDGAVILLWQVVTNELAHSCSQDAAPIMTLTRQCTGAALRLVKTLSYAQDGARTIARASPRLTR